VRGVVLFADSGSTVSWEADEDVILTGALSYGVGLLSLEPDLTLANWNNRPTDQAQSQLRIILNPTGGFLSGLQFEILKGQKIFIAPSGSGQVFQLFFLTRDDVIQLSKPLLVS
jgi:hypothetical protein